MGYLHRDLSNNNILLWFYTDIYGVIRVLGILNDWDLCKSTKYFAKVSRPGRSVSLTFGSHVASCADDAILVGYLAVHVC